MNTPEPELTTGFPTWSDRVAYLDPVRAAAAENALEQAEARIDRLTDELALTRDTLRLRSEVVNTVGATNDTLRATLARIDSTLRLIAPEHITPHGARLIRAALASQEPNA